MLAHLDPQQNAAGRRFVASRPQHVDFSADGRHSVRPEGDSVVLSEVASGREETVSLPGMKVIEASVADDGRTVAVLATRGDNKQLIGVVRDGALKVLDPDTLSRSIDISPDGTRVAASDCFGVRLIDAVSSGTSPSGAAAAPKASANSLKMPVFVDDVEYLPGGQLLAGGTCNGWGGESAPAWFLLDGAGRSEFISGLDEAESLGRPVRPPLMEQIDHAYPNTTPEQRGAIVERYGYQMPHYRTLSGDQRRMIFSMEPMHLDPAQGERGIYFFKAGEGVPTRFFDPSTASVLGSRSLDGARWSSSGKNAAVIFKSSGEPDMFGIAVDDASRFDALPLNVVGKSAQWSADERRVAFDVLDRERHIIYVYDVDARHYFPVLPDATLLGWDGPNLRVRTPDGRESTIAAAALDPSLGTGLVLGSSGSHKDPGEVKVDGDHVDIDGIRVPRRQ